jgi:WD40 repeat protein
METESSPVLTTDGSDNESVWVWEAKTGEPLKVLEGHNDWVKSVGFSPDGNRIISGSDDTSVRVWDAKTGEQLRVLEGHTLWVKSVRFSPDGNQIVSGSDDRSVRVWNAKTGEQLRVLEGHTSRSTWSDSRLMATKSSLVPTTHQYGCGMQRQESRGSWKDPPIRSTRSITKSDERMYGNVLPCRQNNPGLVI